MWLPGYRVELDAKAVPGVDNNLSGLTFDPDLNLLWAVTNGPNELLSRGCRSSWRTWPRKSGRRN